MVISKKAKEDVILQINEQDVERAKEFEYQGFDITESLDPEVEIKKRNRIRQNCFFKDEKFLYKPLYNTYWKQRH